MSAARSKRNVDPRIGSQCVSASRCCPEPVQTWRRAEVRVSASRCGPEPRRQSSADVVRLSSLQRLFFTLLEPICALAGFVYAAFLPDEYMRMLGSSRTSVDPQTRSVLLSLANLVRPSHSRPADVQRTCFLPGMRRSSFVRATLSVSGGHCCSVRVDCIMTLITQACSSRTSVTWGRCFRWALRSLRLRSGAIRSSQARCRSSSRARLRGFTSCSLNDLARPALISLAQRFGPSLCALVSSSSACNIALRAVALAAR